MSGPETPAEVMRRAAKLMRDRTEPVPPSPWRAEGRDVTATQDYSDDGYWDWGRGYIVAACPRQDEAEHIASWSPPVALAVADLLEEIARQYDAPPCDSPDGGCSACEWREDFTDAVRLASAYLGAETAAA